MREKQAKTTKLHSESRSSMSVEPKDHKTCLNERWRGSDPFGITEHPPAPMWSDQTFTVKTKFGALKPEERKKGSDLLSVSLFLHPPNLNCLWLRKHSSMSPLWKHCLMHPPPKQTLASAATIQQKFLPARHTAETLVCLTYSEKKKHSTQEQLCVPQTHPAAATREESIKKKLLLKK